MNSPDSDMDKIRLKRLAKLQSQSSNRPSNEAGSSSGSPKTSEEKASTPVKKAQSPSPAPAPAAQLAPPSNSIPTPRSEGFAQGSSPKRVKQSGTASSTMSGGNAANNLEAWEDKTLTHIFRVSLQPPDNVRGEYLHLKKLQRELEADGEVAVMSTAILDQVILSICSSPLLKLSPFDYLLSCWKRAVHFQRTTRRSGPEDPKMRILDEARRISMCYAEYCITMPELFENVDASVRLEGKLVIDSEDDSGLPLEFIEALVDRFEEGPEIEKAFSDAFQRLSLKLSTLDLTGNYKPYLEALMRIVSITPLAKMFVNHESFLPESVTAHTIETVTLLGPFFKLSPLQTNVLSVYFGKATSRTSAAIQDATRALHLTSQTTQDQLFSIINTLIRKSAEARSRVLDFFARVMNLNIKRTAMHVEPATVASDGFMLNITAVLTRLCEPFMDASFSKIGKVEIEYLRRKPRLSISAETKLNADEQASEGFYSKGLEGENNFISEVFFLTTAAHTYGLGACETTRDQLARDLNDMAKHLEKMQQERSKWLGSPQLAAYDRQLERLRDRIDKGHGYRYGLEVTLFDPIYQARALLFIRYQTTWMLRVVSPDKSYPHKPLSLPLPENPPDEFSVLPEYFVENIGLCFGFVGRWLPHIVIGPQIEEIVFFCITFLRNSTYIRNPHLKSRLVEILFYGIQPNRAGQSGIMGDAINGHPFALKHLLHSLMNFYIEIESQYYQKFTVRYHISEIIKKMWENHAYRGKLEQESRLNPDFFVRFVALLLNDVTYVMDNSLTALVDIHRLQNELESATATSLNPQARQEKEAALAKAEKDASSYMTLGNETVAMLKLFTAALADAFVQPEIVHRLAGMLDYNLDALVGPRGSTLKVKNPEKYGFQPKVLLVNFSEVYLNLRHKPAFIEAIARDGRSYRPEVFERLQKLLERLELRTKEERAELAKMAVEVEAVKRRDEEDEVELGDIPDEFLDPLMATLMEDPVILPSSRVTIDRGTIKTHLLSDAKDPFNRSPLVVDDVIPNTELKEQIERFKKQRREERHAADADVDTGTKMEEGGDY